MSDSPLILAVPKGRILKELRPILAAADVVPEDDFFDDASRKLRFSTNDPCLDIIRVRSFDVARFVSHGAAAFGVVGRDVMLEFDSPELYTPLNLNIGHCRISLAGPESGTVDYKTASHLSVATKYPGYTKRYFAERSIMAECIKLNGAMELAPSIGLSDFIVDLVSTGATLKSNGLKEVEVLAEVSSYLAVNRTVYKTQSKRVADLIRRLEGAVHG